MEHKICNFYLDKEQQEIVEDESKYLLVVAGAGSGKTLTILGKINYLINIKEMRKEEILCFSFTKASSESLKSKIHNEFKLDIPVYTFHKFSLEILKESRIYKITSSDTLETIIYDFFYNKILESQTHMKIVLKYFHVKYRNKKQYLKYLKSNKNRINDLMKLIANFIRLFKCQGYDILKYNEFLKKAKINFLNYYHHKYFLILALNNYLMYQDYLDKEQELDFDDIIIKATRKIEEQGINNKYKFIIIDEYQDTSYIRFSLVKSIIEKTNSSLMAVGDDFQSIYRFTGCDLKLFLDFKKYFNLAKILKIQNTYRNSEELIKIAGNFVMKNKKQIKKNLKSNKKINYPIQLIYYKNIKKQFLKLVLMIYENTKKPILVLGRNNKDIILVLDSKYFKLDNNRIIYLKNRNIIINYLTVHKSKGLEEENVVIINMKDDILGFPNKIKDSKMLKYVSSSFDKYPYSEERRLFYVALTRTRNYVYLLVPKNGESCFIKELKKYDVKILKK